MTPVPTDFADTVLPRLSVFAYLDVEKTPLYRAIMGVFRRTKERFGIHLRPAEVHLALTTARWESTSARGVDSGPDLACTLEEIEVALKQLGAWGNLRGDPDTAEVSTVEEFYRERLLYQLTRQGEAAERAVAVFEEHVCAPGELQTAALSDIRDLLGELEELSGTSGTAAGSAAGIDEGKVHRALEGLRSRFGQLTERAQIFMGGLQRAIDLQGAEEEVFLAYKERLIDYLERFVGELLVSSAAIGEAIRRLDALGVERLLEAAANRELADRVEEIGPQQRREATDVWRGRWQGLHRWFIGDRGAPSQASVLRARTRAAIPALLSAVASLHDRRLQRTDRREDFRTLARWFAEAPSDSDAHRLWHVAFGLDGARHLRVNAETLVAWDMVAAPAQEPWDQAPRLRVAPRMRQYGRYTRSGRPRNVVDRSRDRQQLAVHAEREARRLAAARSHIPVGSRVRLSELEVLPSESFDLLLGLVGEALCCPSDEHGRIRVISADGAYRILLEPAPEGEVAVLRTTAGTLHGRDHFLTLVPMVGAKAPGDAGIDGDADVDGDFLVAEAQR